MSRALPRPALQLITPEDLAAPELLRRVRAALGAGARWVQVRRKRASGRELLELAEALRAVTREAGAVLTVNDRVDVALAAGADGVHLPGGGLGAAAARRLLGAEALIGVSVHASAEIEALAASGADYVQFGPVYDTPSKRAFGTPQGLAALADAASTAAVAGLDLVAVGGIDARRIAEVRAAGAAGVAVIGAALGRADAAAATSGLLAALGV